MTGDYRRQYDVATGNRADASRPQFRIVWKVVLGIFILVAVFIATSLFQHGADPEEWSEQNFTVSYGKPAYIHQDGDKYYLSDDRKNAVGMLSASLRQRGNGGQLFLAQQTDFQVVNAMLHGNDPTGETLEMITTLAAAHYDVELLLKAEPTKRVFIFGYPGAWMKLLGGLLTTLMYLAFVAGFLTAGYFILRKVFVAVEEYFDPVKRRLRKLKNHRCPQCNYDIRKLPQRRCPECNETWSEKELHDAAMMGSGIPSRA